MLISSGKALNLSPNYIPLTISIQGPAGAQPGGMWMDNHTSYFRKKVLLKVVVFPTLSFTTTSNSHSVLSRILSSKL